MGPHLLLDEFHIQYELELWKSFFVAAAAGELCRNLIRTVRDRNLRLTKATAQLRQGSSSRAVDVPGCDSEKVCGI